MNRAAAKKKSTRRVHNDPALAAIGDQIRKVRLQAGVAQEVLAAMAGIERAYYGGIERGVRNPTVVTLARIAHALGTEVGELVPPVSKLHLLLPQPVTDLSAVRLARSALKTKAKP
jgi:transcriptional regulator with XRE-family HTH domain